jgi:MoxR-like ATPase
LPEAQLDRFMFMVNIGYPDKKEERQIVRRTTMDLDADPSAVLSAADILHVQKVLRKLPVSDHVVDFAVSLTRATRPKEPGTPPFINEWLTWGAGPRAAQYLVLGAKAKAVMSGRLNVGCDDVRAVAKPVLRHRLFTNFNADAEGITTDKVVERLLEVVREGSGDDYKDAPRP